MKTLIATVLGEVREVTKFYDNGDFDCPFCFYPACGMCSNPACISTISDCTKAKQYQEERNKVEEDLREREKLLAIRNQSYGRR